MKTDRNFITDMGMMRILFAMVPDNGRICVFFWRISRRYGTEYRDSDRASSVVGKLTECPFDILTVLPFGEYRFLYGEWEPLSPGGERSRTYPTGALQLIAG